IIPQAICARYGLRVGAFFAWPVRILIWIMFIIAYPIAKLLDYILGHKDGVIYRRAELKELIAMHDEDHQGPLNHEEVSILRAVLELRGKTAQNVMTKLEDVLMLPLDAKLDEETMGMLIDAGHSRVPVFNDAREDIIGVILVKQLVLLDPEDALPVYKSRIGRLPRVKKDTPLFELLHVFEEGRSHMAIVVDELVMMDEQGDESNLPNIIVSASPMWFNSPSSPTSKRRRFATLGIITLEDVIEELIGQEIVDETDVYVDVNTKVKVGRVLDILLSRESSALMGSPNMDSVAAAAGGDGLGICTDETCPLIVNAATSPLAYGSTSSTGTATTPTGALQPIKSPGTSTALTPRMKATRKFRETLVPAQELLQEFSARAAPPVYGFEDGQRILISESGEVEFEVPHLTLDMSHQKGASATRVPPHGHELETLD
ncbi:hypothetical protein HDU98_012277, partial [Podochytrium sp. JEL0797]